MQTGRILALDAPAAIGALFPRPLFAVRSRQRMPLLQALRGAPVHCLSAPIRRRRALQRQRTDLPPDRIATELVAALQAAGVDDASVEPIAPDIEDVFIELMGSVPDARVAA